MNRTSKVPTLANVARRARVTRRFIAHKPELLAELERCHGEVVDRFYRAVETNAGLTTDLLYTELERAKAHIVRLQLELARRERRLGAGDRNSGAAPIGAVSPRRAEALSDRRLLRSVPSDRQQQGAHP
jgi:hypothetical protein